jgi:hypothetical protein
MVSRFLGWKLPKDFYPDCYIAFDREKAEKAYAQYGSWPSGTNLLHAGQARAMLEHVLAAPPASSVADAHTCAQAVLDLRGMLLRLIKYEGMANDDATNKLYQKTTDALFAASRIKEGAPSVADAAGAKPCEVCNGVGKIGTPGQRCFGCEGSGQSKFAAIAKESGNDLE